jgi:hypothetical protein
MSEIKHWILKLWYGECPTCHVILIEQKGWGRSDCPACQKHYYHW